MEYIVLYFLLYLLHIIKLSFNYTTLFSIFVVVLTEILRKCTMITLVNYIKTYISMSKFVAIGVCNG